MAFFFTVTFTIYLFLGLHLLSESKKSEHNTGLFIILTILCLVFSYWSLDCAFLVSAADIKDCWFWYRMYVPCLVFFPALLLHFFLLLTSESIYHYPRWLYAIIYIPGLVFLVRGLTGILTIHGFVKNSYGWILIHASDSLWYTAYTIYYIAALASCLSLNAVWYYKTASIREKKQAVLIFISALLTSIINIMLNSVLPALNIYVIPQITQIIILLWIIGIWFAMVKYKFMEATTAITSDEILSIIQEMVLIVSPDLRIKMANKAFQNRFSTGIEDLKNRHISDLVLTENGIHSHLTNLVNGKENWFKCRLNYKNDFEPVVTDSYISRITDRFSDLTGILIISRENKGGKQLRTAFKLTEREYEIFENCIIGISNREIGEKLGIAERTVETHVNNIYNKLNVNNKIELIKVAHEFDLILKDGSERVSRGLF